MSFFEKLFGSFSDKELKRINPLKDKVLALEPEMAKLTDEELQAKTTEFKERLAKGETLDDLLPEAFAVCREADWRVLGMKPYPVQIIGGIVLHRARACMLSPSTITWPAATPSGWARSTASWV